MRLAEHACELTEGKHALLLDTLAAAYAESGEFDKARETADKAVTLARSAGREDWVQMIEKRLAQYHRGVPFHMEPR